MNEAVKECFDLCKKGEVPVDNILLYFGDNINNMYSLFGELIKIELLGCITEIITWFHIKNHRYFQNILAILLHFAKYHHCIPLFESLRKFVLIEKIDFSDEIDYIVTNNERDQFVSLIRYVRENSIPEVVGNVYELGLLYAAAKKNTMMLVYISNLSKNTIVKRKYNSYLLSAYNCPEQLPILEVNGLSPVSNDFLSFAEDGNIPLLKRALYKFHVYHPYVMKMAVKQNNIELLEWLLVENFEERDALALAISTSNEAAVKCIFNSKPRLIKEMNDVRWMRTYNVAYKKQESSTRSVDIRKLVPNERVAECLEKGIAINPKIRKLSHSLEAHIAAHVAKAIREDRKELAWSSFAAGRKLFGYMFDMWFPGGSLESMLSEDKNESQDFHRMAKRLGSTINY